MEPTTVSSHTDSDHSSLDNDSIPSIHPSDSASNYGGEKDTEIVEIVEILHRVPRTVRRSTINHRLHELQLKSNELTIMFNEESTYQRERDEELASAQRVEWIARCIEVINGTSKIQVEIIDHHLSKRKKLECLDYTASLKQIEEWLEQIAAIWARTHNQLRLYSFLLNDNNLLDTEALMLDVRRSFCLLVHESFWIAEPPPEVIVLEKQFDTAVATLIPKAFGNLKLKFKASIVNLDQFYRDVRRRKVKSGQFYSSPNAILENDELTLSVAQSSGYVKFKNLTLHCFARSDFKEREFDSRYHFLYQMVVHFPDLEMCLSCRLISDSVTVVEPCEEATALAFLSDSMESKSNLRSHSTLGSEKRRDIIQVS